MKNLKIAYWIITGIFSAFMLFSGVNFLFNKEDVSMLFNTLGFPSFIIIPLGIAKILGVLAILTHKIKALKELAYAGFFFDFMLAIVSHIQVSDGMFMMPVAALLLLIGSYYLDKRVFEGY